MAFFLRPFFFLEKGQAMFPIEMKHIGKIDFTRHLLPLCLLSCLPRGGIALWRQCFSLRRSC